MIAVKPVTPARAEDFETLFSSKGCPGYCWCSPYRFRDAHKMGRKKKKRAMMARVRKGTPVGVLAYDDGEPIAWCSIAPRQSYEKLGRSTVMPNLGEHGVWTITCLFVRREWRRKGIAKQLIAEALAYARSKKAKTVEAYPFDTAGITATHMGHSSMYKAAGFRRDAGRRWVRRL